MLLTITCEAERATDLGYLLHKNPDALYDREAWFGRTRVFYPEAAEERCAAALLLDVDPIALVRGRSTTLDQYVNDRPYVASSLMSVAIGETFRTAMSGRSKERPDRVEERMRLQAVLAAVDCDAGEPLIRRLFEPLGYLVTVRRAPLDDRFLEWGESTLYTITLQAEQTVRDLLRHLYVLIPVLDNAKHYYIDETEVEKLLRQGEGWLAGHPEKELIARRYLAYRGRYVRAALEALREEGAPTDAEQEAEEERVEAPIRLNEARLQAVLAAIRGMSPSASSVIDLGCGEGRLLGLLLKERDVKTIVGADVSPHALTAADRNLDLARLPERQKERIRLIQGSLLYRDERFAGFDAAVLTEVIEHIEPSRLPEVEQVVFGGAQPRRVVVTTPNAEYNALWPSLPAGRFRHRDHRFEWTRAEFRTWADSVADAYGYTAAFQGIGPEDSERGCPTQMAIFERTRAEG